MKTYIANKPFYIVLKDGKYVTSNKIVLGRAVQTDGAVEWFNTESAYKARLEVVKPYLKTK